MTSKTQYPSKDWLKICITTKAQQKIRFFVKEEQRKRSLLIGKEMLEKEFRKRDLNSLRVLKGELFEKFLKDFGLQTADDIFIRVGYGKLEPRIVIERLVVEEKENVPAATERTTFLERVVKSAQKKSRSGSLVTVDGMDDVLVHFGRCCHPITGDPIVGYISRGRGITIHRADCRKAFAMDQERQVSVEWNFSLSDQHERNVKVQVTSLDAPGLLKQMSEAFSTHSVNINSANIRTTKDKKGICVFDVSVKSADQLTHVILELQKIRGILTVERLFNG